MKTQGLTSKFWYCSDDGDHYDSDPDSGFPRPRNTRKSSPTKEYKDTESIETSPAHTVAPAALTTLPPASIGKLSTPVRGKTRTATPSKRVDLGAAANYGKTQVSAMNFLTGFTICRN